jgi:6-phosphogluconolactonase
LSDERWVPATHADSNEKMVRETLFAGRAAAATLLPLYAEQQLLEERCDELTTALPAIGLPFACALLGMGDDGHIASLFPDAENLELGLQLDGSLFAIPVTTAASPYPRISLTLAALTRSNEIVLLIFGDTKREIYEVAQAGSTGYPVTALLSQQQTPVHVFWAP